MFYKVALFSLTLKIRCFHFEKKKKNNMHSSPFHEICFELYLWMIWTSFTLFVHIGWLVVEEWNILISLLLSSYSEISLLLCTQKSTGSFNQQVKWYSLRGWWVFTLYEGKCYFTQTDMCTWKSQEIKTHKKMQPWCSPSTNVIVSNSL